MRKGIEDFFTSTQTTAHVKILPKNPPNMITHWKIQSMMNLYILQPSMMSASIISESFNVITVLTPTDMTSERVSVMVWLIPSIADDAILCCIFNQVCIKICWALWFWRFLLKWLLFQSFNRVSLCLNVPSPRTVIEHHLLTLRVWCFIHNLYIPLFQWTSEDQSCGLNVWRRISDNGGPVTTSVSLWKQWCRALLALSQSTNYIHATESHPAEQDAVTGITVTSVLIIYLSCSHWSRDPVTVFVWRRKHIAR